MALYVRSLRIHEGQRLQSILRRGKKRTTIRRAQVILMSAQSYAVAEIAEATYLHPEYVRNLIRRFNDEGMDLLKEKARPGRPVIFNEERKAEIVEIAMSPPSLLRQPFSRWSLEKLREYVIKNRIVRSISIETLRTILQEYKIRLQRTKTWKESNDPAFESKKNG